MKANELSTYRITMQKQGLTFYTELFSKAIWGDMGEDCASVYIKAVDNAWQIHYIRTQSGEPYPLSPTVTNVIDEYTKVFTDDDLYGFLSMHQCLHEFEQFMNT